MHCALGEGWVLLALSWEGYPAPRAHRIAPWAGVGQALPVRGRGIACRGCTDVCPRRGLGRRQCTGQAQCTAGQATAPSGGARSLGGCLSVLGGHPEAQVENAVGAVVLGIRDVRDHHGALRRNLPAMPLLLKRRDVTDLHTVKRDAQRRMPRILAGVDGAMAHRHPTATHRSHSATAHPGARCRPRR